MANTIEKGGRSMDKPDRKIPLYLLTVFFLCTLGSALAVVCLHSSRSSFLKENATLFSVLSAATFVGLSAVGVGFTLSKRIQPLKGLLGGLACLSFGLGICLILQKSGFFEVAKDKESLQAYIRKTGAWMPLAYIALQYLQVVILPIPGIVSTAAGVALFGPFFTSVYSFIGIVGGSITAFFIGRKFGVRAVSWLVGEDVLKRWQKKLRGKDNFFFTCAFLLPFFPDDVLCFLAGLSTTSSTFFILLTCFSRAIAIAATCYSFGLIPFTTWWGLTIWGVLLLAFVVTVFVLYKKYDELSALFTRWTKGERSKK